MLAALFSVVAATLAAPAGGFAAELKLGFSLKHLGTHPEEDGAFEETAPSMDRMLTSIRWTNVQHDCSMIRQKRFDWELTDEAMGRIAAEDLTMIATLKDGPPCTQTRAGDNPRAGYVAEYAAFARRLVARYGPRGSHVEGAPLREVEVWSEPNLKSWGGGPASYARAFMAVERQVRSVRRSVNVIVGGPGFCCSPARYLRQLFEKHRFRRVAEHVGAHTYGRSPDSALRRLAQVRRVIPREVQMVITEHGWSTCPSPSGDYIGKCQTLEEQARKMASYVSSLQRRSSRLNLTGFYWFQPQDMSTPASVASCEREPKNFYGIYDHEGAAKPSKPVWEELTGSALPDSIPANPRLRGCDGSGELAVLDAGR